MMICGEQRFRQWGDREPLTHATPRLCEKKRVRSPACRSTHDTVFCSPQARRPRCALSSGASHCKPDFHGYFWSSPHASPVATGAPRPVRHSEPSAAHHHSAIALAEYPLDTCLTSHSDATAATFLRPFISCQTSHSDAATAAVLQPLVSYQSNYIDGHADAQAYTRCPLRSPFDWHTQSDVSAYLSHQPAPYPAGIASPIARYHRQAPAVASERCMHSVHHCCTRAMEHSDAVLGADTGLPTSSAAKGAMDFPKLAGGIAESLHHKCPAADATQTTPRHRPPACQHTSNAPVCSSRGGGDTGCHHTDNDEPGGYRTPECRQPTIDFRQGHASVYAPIRSSSLGWQWELRCRGSPASSSEGGCSSPMLQAQMSPWGVADPSGPWGARDGDASEAGDSLIETQQFRASRLVCNLVERFDHAQLCGTP